MTTRELQREAACLFKTAAASPLSSLAKLRPTAMSGVRQLATAAGTPVNRRQFLQLGAAEAANVAATREVMPTVNRLASVAQTTAPVAASAATSGLPLLLAPGLKGNARKLAIGTGVAGAASTAYGVNNQLRGSSPASPAKPATPALPAKPATPSMGFKLDPADRRGARPEPPDPSLIGGSRFAPGQSNPNDYAGKGEIGGHTWTPTRAPYMKTKAQIDLEQGIDPARENDYKYPWGSAAYAVPKGLAGAVAGSAVNLGGGVLQPFAMAGEGMGVLPAGSAEGIGDARVMGADAAYRGSRQMLMPLKDRSLDTMLQGEQRRQAQAGHTGTAAAMSGADTTASVAAGLSTLAPQKMLAAPKLLAPQKLFQGGGYAPSVLSRQAWQAKSLAEGAKAQAAAGQAARATTFMGRRGQDAVGALPGLGTTTAIGVGDQYSRTQLANQAAAKQLQQPAADPGTQIEQLIGQSNDPQVQAANGGYALGPEHPLSQKPDTGKQIEQLLSSNDPQVQAANQGYSLGPEHPLSTPTIPVRQQMDLEAQQAANQIPVRQQMDLETQQAAAGGPPGVPGEAGIASLPPKDAAAALKQLPPEKQPEAAKAYMTGAPWRYATSKMPDATPEQQQAALQEKATRITQGKPAPEDVEEGVSTLASEHDADISQPNVLTQMFTMWQSLPTEMQYGLAVGIPLAIMGLASAIGGEGGLGALLGIAGLGIAGAGWAMGGMPGMPKTPAAPSPPDPVQAGQDGSRYGQPVADPVRDLVNSDPTTQKVLQDAEQMTQTNPFNPAAPKPAAAEPAATPSTATGDPTKELFDLLARPEHKWTQAWKGSGDPNAFDAPDAKAMLTDYFTPGWLGGGNVTPQQLEPLLRSLPPQMQQQISVEVQKAAPKNDPRTQQILSWLA